MITVSKVRRICDVRGCKNVGAYNITRTRQSGNSVIVCKTCLEEALNVINTQFEAPLKKKRKKTVNK